MADAAIPVNPLDKLIESPKENIDEKKVIFLKNINKQIKDISLEEEKFNATIISLEEEKKEQEFFKKTPKETKEKEEVKKEKKKQIYDAAMIVAEQNCSKFSTTINMSLGPMFKHLSSFIDTISGITKTIGKFSGKIFEAFWDKTVGKLFKVLRDHGGVLFDVILKVSTGIFVIFGWLYTGAKKALGFVYDQLVTLAKFGWDVIGLAFDVLNETAKNILGTLFNSLISILTNPISIVIMAVAFFIYKNEILNFFYEIIGWAWEGIQTFVAKVFFGDDTKKMEAFFDNIWNTVTEFYHKNLIPWLEKTTSIFINIFNGLMNTIFGPTWVYLSMEFKRGWKFITNIWNTVLDYFKSIQSTEILDEIITIYNTIKIWIFGEESVKEELVERENTARLRDALAFNIQNKAALSVERDMLQDVLLGNIQREKLIVSGEEYFQKFIKDVSGSIPEEHAAYIMNKLSINIPTIADKLINMYPALSLSDEMVVPGKTKNLDKLNKRNKEISDNMVKTDMLLGRFLVFTDPKTKGTFNNFGVYSNQKQLDELLLNPFGGTIISTILDLELKNIKEVQSEVSSFFGDSVAEDWYGKYMTDLTTKYRNKIITLKQLQDKTEEFRKATYSSYFTLIKNIATKNAEKRDFINKLKSETDNTGRKITERFIEIPYFKNLSPVELASIFNRFLPNAFNAPINEKDIKEIFNTPDNSRWVNPSLPPLPYASGGIMKQPTHALLAEAGYPELVIPLNKDGMEFVYNSMKDFIVKESENNIPQNKQNEIVKRIKKGLIGKPDVKLYDMKNLSMSIVRIK